MLSAQKAADNIVLTKFILFSKKSKNQTTQRNRQAGGIFPLACPFLRPDTST
jgi:hypothetical protein